jgi:hypothetical protein
VSTPSIGSMIPVDETKSYVLSANVCRSTGSVQRTYLGVRCYDASGVSLGSVRYCTLNNYQSLNYRTATRYSGTISGSSASPTHNQFWAGTKYVTIYYIPIYETLTNNIGVIAWDFQFEEGEYPTGYTVGLRGNVNIDSNRIMVGTPNAARLELSSAGLRGYNSGNTLQAYFDTDGVLKAGGGNVKLGAGGITVLEDNTRTEGVIEFVTSGGSRIGEMYASASANSISISARAVGAAAGNLQLFADDVSGGQNMSLALTPSTDTLTVLSGVTTLASLTPTTATFSGRGIFTSLGLRLPVQGTIPSGGTSGDGAILYESGANRRLYFNVNGTWRYATLT